MKRNTKIIAIVLAVIFLLPSFGLASEIVYDWDSVDFYNEAFGNVGGQIHYQVIRSDDFVTTADGNYWIYEYRYWIYNENFQGELMPGSGFAVNTDIRAMGFSLKAPIEEIIGPYSASPDLIGVPAGPAGITFTFAEEGTTDTIAQGEQTEIFGFTSIYAPMLLPDDHKATIYDGFGQGTAVFYSGLILPDADPNTAGDPVPEPGTLLLLGSGLLGMAGLRGRRKKA